MISVQYTPKDRQAANWRKASQIAYLAGLDPGDVLSAARFEARHTTDTVAAVLDAWIEQAARGEIIPVAITA